MNKLAILFCLFAACAYGQYQPRPGDSRISGTGHLTLTSGTLAKTGTGTLTLFSDGSDNINVGGGNSFTGSLNTIFGNDNVTTGQQTVTFGYNNNVGDYSANVGYNIVSSTGAVAIGYNAGGAQYSVAVGYNAVSGSSGCVALGLNSLIDQTWSDTIELGNGEAELQGGINFRGLGIVDYNSGAPKLTSGVISASGLLATSGTGLASMTDTTLNFGNGVTITAPAASGTIVVSANPTFTGLLTASNATFSGTSNFANLTTFVNTKTTGTSSIAGLLSTTTLTNSGTSQFTGNVTAAGNVTIAGTDNPTTFKVGGDGSSLTHFILTTSTLALPAVAAQGTGTCTFGNANFATGGNLVIMSQSAPVVGVGPFSVTVSGTTATVKFANPMTVATTATAAITVDYIYWQ